MAQGSNVLEAGRRFRQFIIADLFTIGAGTVFLLAIYGWVVRSGYLLLLAGLVAGLGVLVASAARPLARGDLERSATIVCLATWAVAIGLTLLVPALIPVFVLTGLMPVLFALPYVSRARLRLFLATSVGGIVALGLVARLQDVSGLAGKVPGWLMDSALVIALSILGGLILLIVWQDADTLQDALDQVMNSNRALQASEELLARHADELAESRARVVAATDRERRRIERDLHDGAQQRLVALAVNLLVARQQSEAEPARSRVLLDQVADQLQVAIAEIRDLAHGIYPPLLANRGLAEALPAAVARAPLPARVVTSDIGRYPPHVEAAVYFCCLEGLQNAAKHAGPTASVTITVTGSGRGLEFEIIDTGVGFDTTDAGRGSGLVNMADRLAVVGGTLAIESRPQCGTRIIGTIPIPAHNITHDVSSR